MAFYDAILDHDELGPYFDDVDMKALIDHQTKFMSSVLGGPASFNDAQLRNAHSDLSIPGAHFDAMKVVLGETLSEHGFDAADVGFVLGEVEARRDIIVTA